MTFRVPGLAGHAKALTAAFGALALITGVAAAAAPAVLAAPAVPPVAAAPALATGAAAVSQPSIPATCTTLDAQLETSDELFSSSDESTPPDTTRIQDALNSCSGTGKAVVLAPSGSDNAFLSGPLSLPASVTLVVDDGATLYASRNPANYQVSGQATCGTTASTGNGCKPFINVTGSDAGIMGTQGSNGSQGEIDGRGDQDILGTSTTWWALSSQAQTDDDQQNNPRLIESDGHNNLTVYDIDLVNAPLFHIYFQSGDGLTVWGVRIKTPATARNTDGVDPDSSTNVTVNASYIQDGDDGIAIKTNASAASDITIENSHFYGTHGISIGSETQFGVSNVLIDKTQSGNGQLGQREHEQQRDPDQDRLERRRQGQRRHLRRHLRDGRAGPGRLQPVLRHRQRLHHAGLHQHRGGRPQVGRFGVRCRVRAGGLRLVEPARPDP